MTKHTQLRQDHLDCAHGLMILHMMFYHLCGSTIYNTPYYYPVIHTLSFFMAWFFFKSGMLYKNRQFGEVLRLGFKRLFIPAVVFATIGLICHLIANHPQTSIPNELEYAYIFGAFRGNGPIWFLFTLFAIQLLYNLICYLLSKLSLITKICKKTLVVQIVDNIQKKQREPALIAIIALVWLFLNKYLGCSPLWAYNIPLGLMFFSFGQLFKKLQYYKTVIIISAIIYFGLYFVHTKIDFLFGTFKPFVIAIPWVLSGSILLNVLFKSFPRICIPPLRFYARHSMEFLCTHMLVFTFLEGFLKNNTLHISNQMFIFIVFSIYFIAMSLILHFFKLKHIQWMFGRKRS